MFLHERAASAVSMMGNYLLSYHNSPLYEFFSNFMEAFYGVEFHVYRHIDLGSDANQTAQFLILGIAIGLIFASAIMSYTRTKLGNFVRILIKNDCLSPENAKTLHELGAFRNASVRRALARGLTLRKYVLCTEEADFDPETAKAEALARQKSAPWWKKMLLAAKAFFVGNEVSFRPDFKTAHFYLPADIKDRAELRFERKGSGCLTVLITAVAALVFASILCKLLPDILQLMDNIISMMSPA